MAEHDRHQGLLKAENEAFIAQSVKELIVELSDYSYKEASDGAEAEGPRQPPTEGAGRRQETRVVCIPANDQADEITASIVAQVVEQAGYPTVSLSATGSTVEIHDFLSTHPDHIVCICALPPFAVLHARTLSKQLRAQFPEVQIIVGIWNVSVADANVHQRLGKAFQDTVVTTLKQVLVELDTWTPRFSSTSISPQSTSDSFASALNV
jgi:hypothetical protein